MVELYLFIRKENQLLTKYYLLILAVANSLLSWQSRQTAHQTSPHRNRLKCCDSLGLLVTVLTHEKLELVACSWLHRENYIIIKPFSWLMFSLRSIISIFLLGSSVNHLFRPIFSLHNCSSKNSFKHAKVYIELDKLSCARLRSSFPSCLCSSFIKDT